MEKLKGIRKRMRYTGRMNRKLHSMPLKKLQNYISYKSMEHGFELIFVEARNTSRICPICGELNKPNGHVFKCKKCEFQAYKHLIAAWNIVNKLSMCRLLPLVTKAFDGSLKIEVRGKR